MTQYILKVLLSAGVVVAVTELSKRSTFLGGLLASLPLTSLLAFVWLYRDTRDAAQVAALSWSILWLVLPSLLLFIVLPVLLRRGWAFHPALLLALGAMLAAYFAEIALLKKLGIPL